MLGIARAGTITSASPSITTVSPTVQTVCSVTRRRRGSRATTSAVAVTVSPSYRGEELSVWLR